MPPQAHAARVGIQAGARPSVVLPDATLVPVRRPAQAATEFRSALAVAANLVRGASEGRMPEELPHDQMLSFVLTEPRRRSVRPESSVPRVVAAWRDGQGLCCRYDRQGSGEDGCGEELPQNASSLSPASWYRRAVRQGHAPRSRRAAGVAPSSRSVLFPEAFFAGRGRRQIAMPVSRRSPYPYPCIHCPCASRGCSSVSITFASPLA